MPETFFAANFDIGVPADMPFGFAAAQAPEAFDLIEKEPQRTLKVQLDFS